MEKKQQEFFEMLESRDIELPAQLTGQFTAYPMLKPSDSPYDIRGGKNGLVWFVENNNSTQYVLNIDTATGSISEYALEGAAPAGNK